MCGDRDGFYFVMRDVACNALAALTKINFLGRGCVVDGHKDSSAAVCSVQMS